MTDFSMTVTRTSAGLMSFNIEDADSGINVLRGDMTFDNFTRLITGVGNVRLDVIDWRGADPRVGKKRVCLEVLLTKEGMPWTTEQQKEHIIKSPEVLEAIAEGWVMACDGTSSQQNGKMWRVMLVRYEDIK